jgi:hypothetical protein
MGYKDKKFSEKKEKNPQGIKETLSIKKTKQVERVKKIISILGKLKEHIAIYGLSSGGGYNMGKNVIGTKVIKVIKMIREYHLGIRKESTRILKAKVMQGGSRGKRGVLWGIWIVGIKCAKCAK